MRADEFIGIDEVYVASYMYKNSPFGFLTSKIRGSIFEEIAQNIYEAHIGLLIKCSPHLGVSCFDLIVP